MADLTRQQFCAEMNVSESSVRRFEKLGMPTTPVGISDRRYNLEECRHWLRENLIRCLTGKTNKDD